MDEKEKNKKKFHIINGGKNKEKISDWKRAQMDFTNGRQNPERTTEDMFKDLEELRKERNKEKD